LNFKTAILFIELALLNRIRGLEDHIRWIFLLMHMSCHLLVFTELFLFSDNSVLFSDNIFFW